MNGKYGFLSLSEWYFPCFIHSNVLESLRLYIYPDMGWYQPIRGLSGVFSVMQKADGVSKNF